MYEKLKIKAIYDDFLDKVQLSEEQIKILNMLINRDKIIKIAMELGVSERTVKYEIQKIKKLYNNYMELEIARLLILTT